MYTITGHIRVLYASDHLSATVEVVPASRDTNKTYTYDFDGSIQSGPTRVYSLAAGNTGSANIRLIGTDIAGAVYVHVFDPIDFIWNAKKISLSSGDYRNGQKGAVAEMFGWPHADVEKECDFLSRAGYLGVKLFPTHEQLLAWDPYDGELNPWYFMYQPVSYRLQGRAGDRNQLKRLIDTCRSKNVRVYADAVVNHMTGCGNDAHLSHRNPGAGCAYWGAKTSSAADPSPFYTQCYGYQYNHNTYKAPQQEFPAVPYGPTDFHCERSLNSWTDPTALDAGWLVGLTDLHTGRPNVQQRIADYMTDLLGIGFSGFRVDAAKHIKPDSLAEIFARLKSNLGGRFPDDFFVWNEIIIGGEASLLFCNENSGYNYGKYFENKLYSLGFTSGEVDKIKIWFSGYPKEPSVDCDTVSKWRKVVQNDDHDQQNDGSSSRDMGDQGSVLVKEKDVDKHRSFEIKLFTNPNGAYDNNNDYPIRFVLSSHYFAANGASAIPDGLSDCKLCVGQYCGSCQTVEYSPAYSESSQGYDFPTYTRVHRDIQIVNAMRSWVQLPPLSAEELFRNSTAISA
eukprot:TRINITY_DN15041_c0_g1_i1.p1 TRINITY_DN15041_c0_g1~~TRINITY_DN15041_c0_g1_i1.p1  ORF type:complete len:639 (-),score=137.14 TRINITY_DN15041_c0_g1_i1:39-1736(-)